MFFKPLPVYIKLYYNAIEVTNLNTMVTIKRLAVNSFSNKRLVLANFDVAEKLLREILNDLRKSKFGIYNSLKTLIHIVENLEGGISELEKRGLRDLAELAGSRKIYLWPDSTKLSDDEALHELTILDKVTL